MWRHKKQKQVFMGSYQRDKNGERVFVLTRFFPKVRRITFESWQMAKKLGWKKVTF